MCISNNKYQTRTKNPCSLHVLKHPGAVTRVHLVYIHFYSRPISFHYTDGKGVKGTGEHHSTPLVLMCVFTKHIFIWQTHARMLKLLSAQNMLTTSFSQLFLLEIMYIQLNCNSKGILLETGFIHFVLARTWQRWMVGIQSPDWDISEEGYSKATCCVDVSNQIQSTEPKHNCKNIW